MLWVYGYYKYVYSYSAWIDFRRQNLTSTDLYPRAVRTKVDPRAVRVNGHLMGKPTFKRQMMTRTQHYFIVATAHQGGHEGEGDKFHTG